MKTWNAWAILSGIMALWWASGAGAQEPQVVVPMARDISVVPAIAYEPQHPQRPTSPGIKQASYQETTANVSTPPLVDFDVPHRSEMYHIWGRAEYLNLRINDAPIAVPLVTTAGPGSIGALNEADTVILFGAGSGRDVQFGRASGMRFTIGGWLENDYEYGWEASGLFTERRSFLFNAVTPGGAAPVISIPFFATQPFNNNPLGETSLNSGGAPTSASVYLTSLVWGLELKEFAYLWVTDRYYLTASLGFRFLGVDEMLRLTYTNFDFTNAGEFSIRDEFRTYNQYFAAQIGTRGGLTFGRWTMDAGVCFLAGPMRQIVNVAGATTVTNGAFGFADSSTPSGVFAQTSNIGSHHRTVMAYGTEFQFKLNFALSQRIQPFIGYNGLYVNSIARPGNQIDRTVNPTQNAVFVPPGAIVGGAAPITTIRGSEFWAHGMQVGVEFRY